MIYQSHFQQNCVQLLKVYVFLTIFIRAKKKQKITEIEKNKNGKCFVIIVFILPYNDGLFRRPFAY